MSADSVAKSAENQAAANSALSDDLKNGKLIRYGFTAGAALAVHLPLSSLQRGVAPSALPYAAVLPGWFFTPGDITKAYCASAFVGGTPQEDADHAAQLKALAAVQRTGRLPAPSDNWKPSAKYLAEHGLIGDGRAHTVKEFKDNPGAFPGTVYDATDWIPDVRANCTLAKWLPGIYVGVPASFSVNAEATAADKTEKSRQFSPLFSAGLIVAPMSVFSVMAGITLSNVQDNNSVNHQLMSLTVSLGGNLDLVGLLLGGGGGSSKK